VELTTVFNCGRIAIMANPRVKRPTRTTAAILAGLLALTAAAACERGRAAAGDGVSVLAAFYPLRYVAERVGGPSVTVDSLVPPGAEPHDLELTAQMVRAVADADLVVYLRGFQPQVDATIDQQAPRTALDVTTVQALTADDPHIWLDPTRLAAVGDAVAARLAAVAPESAAGFRERAASLRTDLEQLDREYADGLADCARREIVTSHAAFGYLAQRYRLTQIAITGLSPEAEPSPGRLAEVTRLAREHRVTTIFFETLVSPRLAETLAREVGARPEVLDPIEAVAPDSTDDYRSVMLANLGRLRTALDC
jgi:zinc transport system substrate-binding protein